MGDGVDHVRSGVILRNDHPGSEIVRPVGGSFIRVDDVRVIDKQQAESAPDTTDVDRLPQSVQHQNRVLEAGHRGSDFTEKKECIK